jgi:hypothetical protein
MSDKALLVGINAYPGCPLSGCLNDIGDMADFLVKKYNFKYSQIRLLADGRATTKEILSRLNWLIQVSPGDRVVFHYSGHGAQFAGRGSNEEIDKLNEVICPVDFDWTEPHMISDKQFYEIFSHMPKGVRFNWVSDSCHSGDLTKDMPPPGAPVNKARAYPMPIDMAWRVQTATELKIHSPEHCSITNGILDVGFISGCRSNQTSADTVVNGRPCGALTHFLLAHLALMMDKPISEVVRVVNASLSANRYSQQPQAEGTRAILPFLQ